MPALNVGDAAPDFELEDQNGKKVRLSQYRGKKNVLLAFAQRLHRWCSRGPIYSWRDQHACYGGVQGRLAVVDRTHRSNDLVRVGVLHHVPVRAGLECCRHE